MKSKKILAIVLSVLLIMLFNACHNNEPSEIVTENGTENSTYETTSDKFFDATTTVPSADDKITEMAVETTLNEVPTSAFSVKDISEWTEAEIVDAYKNAAIKSHSSVTSQHSVEVTKIEINGEELGGAFDFVKGIISTFISNNSEDSKGITGGYKNLSESDVASIKSYKVGKNTAIEMVMKNQTDGAKTDAKEGSVGHAIDVVGDISTVTSELTELGLPIEISAESTTIYYSNPVVKVLIDENGKIIKGTWRYTVEISLKDYKVFGANVQSSSIVMDNVITVNGGF